jgi:hypothetical protein
VILFFLPGPSLPIRSARVSSSPFPIRIWPRRCAFSPSSFRCLFFSFRFASLHLVPMPRLDLRSGAGSARATVAAVWWAVGSRFRGVWFGFVGRRSSISVRSCLVVGAVLGEPAWPRELVTFFSLSAVRARSVSCGGVRRGRSFGCRLCTVLKFAGCDDAELCSYVP